MEKEEIYRKLLTKFGTSNQILKLAEECAELAQAAIKLAVGPANTGAVSFVREMVDVEIMLEQIKQLLDDPVFVKFHADRKEEVLKNLEKLLEV